MRIAVVGAGSLGCLVAGLLHRGGQDLVLVERRRSALLRLRRHGFRLLGAGGRAVRFRIPVTAPARLQGPVDLILIAVKSYDTGSAIAGVVHALGDGTLVGSLQNGLGNLEVLAAVAGAGHVFCASVTWSAATVGAGIVRWTGGRAPMVLAPFDDRATPGFRRAVRAFSGAGIPTRVSRRHDEVLWRKLVMNAGANALSAITGRTCRDLTVDAGLSEIIVRTVGEAAAVARALGIAVPEPRSPAAPLLRVLRDLGDNKTSMLQDLEAGRRTETDAINGAIVRLGAETGVPTPLNRLLHEAILGLEAAAGLRPPADGPAAPVSARAGPAGASRRPPPRRLRPRPR